MSPVPCAVKKLMLMKHRVIWSLLYWRYATWLSMLHLHEICVVDLWILKPVFDNTLMGIGNFFFCKIMLIINIADEGMEMVQLTRLSGTLVSSLWSKCVSCCQLGHAGSKTLLWLNPPVMNWGCQLVHVVLYNGCNMVVVDDCLCELSCLLWDAPKLHKNCSQIIVSITVFCRCVSFQFCVLYCYVWYACVLRK